jgi:hypothetical protein
MRRLPRRGLPLMGSLFWRWDVQVYAGEGPRDYGVRSFDSTFPIIARHAALLRKKRITQPPRAECRTGCWVPRRGLTNTCVK